MKDIADYIEPLYNQRKRYSILDNLSPAEYELKHQQNLRFALKHLLNESYVQYSLYYLRQLEQ